MTENIIKPAMKLSALLRRLWQEESGQDLIEYSLLLAFLALSTLGLVRALNTSGISTVFRTTANALNSAS